MDKQPKSPQLSVPEGGEGDRRAARHYNDAARAHAQSGEVDRAAREAADSVDAAPKAHREAEAAGKVRAAAFEPDPRAGDPARERSAWQRLKSFVKRHLPS